jgi:hypothetical protein
MDAVKATGAAGAAADQRSHLLGQGFSAQQAERLIALKRHERQRLPHGLAEKRLRFVRWLVEHHRLHDGAPLGPGLPSAAASSA